MLHQVPSDHGEAFLGSNDGLDVGPLALETLLLALDLVFGQFLNRRR